MPAPSPSRLPGLRLGWLTAVLWTVVVIASLAWNRHRAEEDAFTLATAEARANFNKDISFRRWATAHGGVYVPVTPGQPPIAWLAHIPERDVTTPSGRQLTLLNPATMIRQVMDAYARDYGVRGRITGLKYINPDNAPDAWERARLLEFQRGARTEAMEVVDIAGKPYLRYFQAMFMEPGCMKCHAVLGYKVGELRGGIGVNVPLEPYYNHLQATERSLALSHGGIWLLGLAGIGVAARQSRRRQGELFAEKERAQVTLSAIADAVVSTDAEGRVRFMNPVAATLSGWPEEKAKGRPLAEVIRLVDEDSGEPLVPPPDLADPAWRLPRLASLVTPEGGRIAVEGSLAPLHGEDGQARGGVLVFRDVTQARELHRRMSWQISHDSLTGLFSRREFEHRLDLALADAQRTGQRHALLFMDLDRFKSVNDTAGHPAGDALLRKVAGRLAEQMRRNDSLARLGGDEFAALLDGCPLDNAREIAEKLRRTVAETEFEWEGRRFRIGLSVGLLMLGPETGSVAEAMAAVDQACYAAKDAGRDRVVVYSPDMPKAAGVAPDRGGRNTETSS